MEGTAAGWVAVGFSNSRAMVSWYSGSVTETLDFICKTKGEIQM